jgi:alkanesulfonate monooxygenase SsuD/methylene tetrahydromethanopterin reductase-like flavin-dependent oxidoreductase (luciferase family)
VTETRFGLNIFPTTDLGADPLAQAHTAESLGFDFVSIPDHPGSASPCYETWTLLTWIAATTSRLGIIPRVLGAPFRQPALMAKAAESLDRLSAGRLVLGLGAGSNDVELHSLGLSPEIPGGKLRGLKEAIDIIYGMWRESRFTYDGSVYRTDGASLEPKPVRQIPVWIGTHGVRGLAVTGRLADGWIPSLAYAPGASLVEMRGRVVEAAISAGRDPAAITCALSVRIALLPRAEQAADMLIGPPGQIIDLLSRYVDLGFSTFSIIPIGDDLAEQVERIAAEVIPAFRPSMSAVDDRRD